MYENRQHLEGFRRAQRLAYDVVTKVGAELVPGKTERDVAASLRDALVERGVTDWFHRPFAWFGPRTAFHGMRRFTHFLPEERALGEGESAILDVAPIVDGYIADVGYSCAPQGATKALRRVEAARKHMRYLREQIPAWFGVCEGAGEVWLKVEDYFRQHGLENCYQRYPFSVLGHQVSRVSARRKFGWSVPFGFLSWFGLSAYQVFLSRGIGSQLIQRNSRHKNRGLWAIEPHFGLDGEGAKFEEILVVDEMGARWLDDQVPHL